MRLWAYQVNPFASQVKSSKVGRTLDNSCVDHSAHPKDNKISKLLEKVPWFFDITDFSPGIAPVLPCYQATVLDIGTGPFGIVGRHRCQSWCQEGLCHWKDAWRRTWYEIYNVKLGCVAKRENRMVGTKRCFLGAPTEVHLLNDFLSNRDMFVFFEVYSTFMFSFCGCNVIHCMIRYIYPLS